MRGKPPLIRKDCPGPLRDPKACGLGRDRPRARWWPEARFQPPRDGFTGWGADASTTHRGKGGHERGEENASPPFPLSPEEAGFFWGKGGAESYVLYHLLYFGPKSTDPNLEAEAPSVTFWCCEEGYAAPRNSASSCTFACSEGGGWEGGGGQLACSRSRCPSGIGERSCFLILPPIIILLEWSVGRHARYRRAGDRVLHRIRRERRGIAPVGAETRNTKQTSKCACPEPQEG